MSHNALPALCLHQLQTIMKLVKSWPLGMPFCTHMPALHGQHLSHHLLSQPTGPPFCHLLSLALLPSDTFLQSFALWPLGAPTELGSLVQPVNYWLLYSRSEIGSAPGWEPWLSSMTLFLLVETLTNFRPCSTCVRNGASAAVCNSMWLKLIPCPSSLIQPHLHSNGTLITAFPPHVAAHFREREREIIFIGTPNLCSPHHRLRPTVILVAACAARVNMKRKLFRLT